MRRLALLILAAAFVLGAAIESQAGLFDFLHKKRGCGGVSDCCAPAPTCCAPAPPSCCAPAPVCAPAPTCCAPAPTCAGGAPMYGIKKAPYEETPPPPKAGGEKPPLPKKANAKPPAPKKA